MMKNSKKLLALLLAIIMILSAIPVTAAKGFGKTNTWSTELFSDVQQSDWFGENVKSAYELGLMKGDGEGRFLPEGNITLAETVTVAARIHAIATRGEENFVQGNPWYQVYVDYALANGILEAALQDYTRKATRLEYARILSKALPAEDLKAINDVKYGEIPDVADDEAVYQLYRAGILMGNDAQGTFAPNSNIKRSEVAAIVTRMALPELRIEKEAEKQPSNTGNIQWPSNGGSGSRPAPAPADDVKVTVAVESENGAVKNDVSMTSDKVSATVPAGVVLDEGAKELTLTVNAMEQSGSGVAAGEGEEMTSYDVHIEGVSKDNTVVITVTLGEILSKGLNLGNVTLYHVENGTANAMTQVNTLSDLDVHNEFYYDPATGEVTVALKSFSEIALVADTENAWEGEFDYTWYDASKTELTIANADQLAGFGAIVGGMAKDENGNYIYTATNADGEEIHYDTFASKTVKLIADINLGDKDNANGSLIFYPIGYYNSTGSYEKTSGVSVTSNVSSFSGTFDGNGHTIKNFYQNTWEMFGDYNDGYSGTPNHYKDAMGLFGYVNGGTVKNLTVDNFSSDGEFTPTGVIAAYAAGNALFENITIFNCNPRVYNTGNGGIVGIGGDTESANTPDNAITLKNITVDQSNIISALWGSYDVACGGLMGMFRGYSKVNFDNCHVAAQIDVNNDVCANYQYYWYRYSGMFIGSVRRNTTDGNYTVAYTDGITATNCTYTYGDWNEYWYCELVANSLASYTHDHQFSRLTKIADISEIKSGDTWIKEGNFVLPAADNSSATCYHIFKNQSGEFYQHFHNVADATNPNIYETFDLDNNGELDDLKEDRTCYYMPFAQLLNGNGYGVRAHYEFNGFTEKENGTVKAVEKFEPTANISIPENAKVNVGDLFAAIVDASKISSPTVQVYVSPVGDDSSVSAKYTQNASAWDMGTLTFTGTGAAKVVITDYFYSKPVSAFINVGGDASAIKKFALVFDNENFTYRVGNANGSTVALDKMFKAVDGATIDAETVKVSIEPASGNAAGQYTANTTTWTDGTIQFTGTGVVTVTISALGAQDLKLTLEVVDAVNATDATSATKNNVVLLNDCGFGSLEVSGGYTLYGNGFTVTCGNDSAALDMGYAFVTLNNGTLDNVQIVCPNFDYAVLYKSNMTESGNRSQTTDKTRYFNVKSGVMVSGNSQILNSRISGGRAAVNVSGGNLLIDNSRIELGAVASLLVGAANGLTLRDVTLVQKPTASTYDPNKTLMGFSTLFICDANGDTAPVTLEGSLVQNAWVDENDKQYVPSAGQNIISTVLGKTEYLHDIDGDGKNESLNLGFAYMPESLTSKVNTTTITDNRTNKDTVPYDYAEVSILNGKTYVYSYKNTNGTADSFKTESEYKPNKYSDIITVTYSDTADGLTTGKTFGTDDWVYELNVDLDKLSGYALDFSKLSMNVNGTNITDFKVNGSAKPTSPVAVTAGGVTYTLTATVNGKEYTATYKVTGTETSKESPSLVAANYEAGLCVASSYGGTWHGAAPALQGIQIRYWSVAEKQYKTITLSDYTPTTKGQLNGTNNTWTYSPANGDFTLTLTGGQVHSSNKVDAMPVVCDGKLYFVAAKSNGLVNSGNSARTIPVSYTFKDNNNGDVLTFSHTWSVAENKDAQYKYSDFCSGTLTKLEASSSGGGCLTPDTLITMADGSQVRVDSLTGNEELLVWNMETGMLDSASILFVDSDAEAEYEIVQLYFSDGTDVKVIYEHGFWDYDLNKYVYLDRYAEQYIGHTFAKQNGEELEKVQLVDVVLETEVTTAWSPVTVEHLCYFVNGMLSMPGGVGGLFNIFDVNPETMSYDLGQMQKDIEIYGLFTYEELNAIEPLSEEMFNAAGGAYLKVSMGKGNLTMDELRAMIQRYSVYFQ